MATRLLEDNALLYIFNGLQLEDQAARGPTSAVKVQLTQSLAECIAAFAAAEPLCFYHPSRFTLFTLEEVLRLMRYGAAMVASDCDPEGKLCEHGLSIMEGALRRVALLFTETNLAYLLEIVDFMLQPNMPFPPALRSRLLLFIAQFLAKGGDATASTGALSFPSINHLSQVLVLLHQYSEALMATSQQQQQSPDSEVQGESLFALCFLLYQVHIEAEG